jgi:disulfide bond formation protein DsbB
MGKPERIGNPRGAGLNGVLPYLAWLIALVSTVGSLFFSEVMGLQPCVLCWYQRVAVYPLVLVIGAGIVMRDVRMKYYALPLCLAGLAVAVYHNLLYYGLIPEAVTPCAQGVPCTERQIEWLGFITIPLMGLAAFLGLTLCLLLYKPGREGDSHA